MKTDREVVKEDENHFFLKKKEYGDHHQTLPICVSGGTYMRRNEHDGLLEWSEVGEIHRSL